MTPDRLAATALAVALGAQPDEINDCVDRFMDAPDTLTPVGAVEIMRHCLGETLREWLNSLPAMPAADESDAAVQRLHAEAVDRFLRQAAKPLNDYKKEGES